ATTGRDHLDKPRAVAILGKVAGCLDDNTLAPALPNGQRCGPGFALPVLPPGEALAFTGEDFGRQRNGFGHLFLKNGPHGSPTLSFRSQLQPEIVRQSVRQVEPKRVRATDETHDARPLYPGRPFEGDVGHPALQDGPPQHVGHGPTRLVHPRPLCELSQERVPSSSALYRKRFPERFPRRPPTKGSEKSLAL